jgi:hypothetical protein
MIRDRDRLRAARALARQTEMLAMDHTKREASFNRVINGIRPVQDHTAEGDGSEYPTWCWCGRSFSEHQYRP